MTDIEHRPTTEHRTSAEHRRSTANLLSELVDDALTLVRAEGQLARAEIKESVDRGQQSLGMFAAGAVCLLAALIVLLDALIIGLANLGIPVGWSALIVGVVVAAIGLWLLSQARAEGERMFPDRTFRHIKEDAGTVRRSFKR